MEPHHRWGRAIEIDENIYSADDLGNMTMLLKHLLLCKSKMSPSWGKATERQYKEFWYSQNMAQHGIN